LSAPFGYYSSGGMALALPVRAVRWPSAPGVEVSKTPARLPTINLTALMDYIKLPSKRAKLFSHELLDPALGEMLNPIS
jgi:hypothetical protein